MRLCGLLLLSVLVVACQTPPKREPVPVADPRVQSETYHADQEQRLARLRRWQVSGILEVSTEQGKKRYRTEIQGEAARRAKVTIFGFMQQVGGMLFASSEEIRLVDADKQQIVEVPASAEGLRTLIGVGLHPEELLESLVALAGGLAELDAGVPNGWLARSGEQLILDPTRGLIQQRTGQTEAGGTYHVSYQWPENPANLPVPMPEEIRVLLSPGETQLNYTARQWRFIDQPFAERWFSPLESHAGFAVYRPMQEGPAP